ncbi:MAG: histidine kinase [Firmicutes bacterium]|nr:histidine kinase [Bacillota bacterium]
MADKTKREEDLLKKIEELKKRLPAHSVKPQMIRELEDLEQELENLRPEKH